MNVQARKLVLASGWIGLIGGLFLLLFVPLTVVVTVLTLGIGAVLSIFIAFAIKVASIILGIVCLTYYKSDARISFAGGVLLIVGGGIALIDFLGWFGGIILIVAGIMFLNSLSKFNPNQVNY